MLYQSKLTFSLLNWQNETLDPAHGNFGHYYYWPIRSKK